MSVDDAGLGHLSLVVMQMHLDIVGRKIVSVHLFKRIAITCGPSMPISVVQIWPYGFG